MDNPIYCKDCNSYDTFILNPAGDVYDDNKNLMWVSFKCKKCGHKTLRRVGNGSND